MLQLFNPFWLIALAGLLVPVAIHLWNKKPGRTIKVGSIRWLEEAASQRLSSLRLYDLWLLLLRMVIVALLALLLTQPRWIRQNQASARNLILISPEMQQSARFQSIQTMIDSLRQQKKFELRSFSPGFPLLSEKEISTPSESRKEVPDQEQYWTLLEGLGRQQPMPSEVFLFTSAGIRHFSEKRPAVSVSFTWITVPIGESTQWLQEAFLTRNDSLEIIIGHSDAQGTRFRKQRTELPKENTVIRKAGFRDLTFSRKKKSFFVEWKGENSSRIPIQEAVQHLIIYHQASRTEDVRYLKAALESWLDNSGRKYQLDVTGKIPAPAQPADWIFWLSEEPVPESMRQRMAEGMRLFRDGNSEKSKALRTQLIVPGLVTSIKLFRQDTLRETGQAIWKNNFGQSVLTFNPKGKGGTYHFHSRLHPDWSELPESAVFPQLVGLLLNPASEPDLLDARILDESQIQPVRVSSAVNFGTETPRRNDLRPFVGLLALLLFGLERMLVQVKRKTVTYNQPKEIA